MKHLATYIASYLVLLISCHSSVAFTRSAASSSSCPSLCSSSSLCHFVLYASLRTNTSIQPTNISKKDNQVPTTTISKHAQPQLWRRRFLTSSAAHLLLTSTLLLMPIAHVAHAGSLLEDYGGSDPSKLVQPKNPDEEYIVAKKGVNAIDPTLRASYYFPTARKRYLPRIQKVSDQLKQVLPKAFANKNQNSNWLDDVQSLYTTADNAILPMKLYTSSLDGQGLRMTQSEFVKTMKVNIDKYERNVQQLSKALDQQDKTMAQTAVQQLSQALADFRSAGKLSEDIEDLPSVDEVRRMTMRRPTMKFTQY